MTTHTVDVHIIGRKFKVSCPEEEHDALQEAIHSLDKRLETLKQRINAPNSEHLVLIVALNLCNELCQEKEKCRSIKDELEKRAQLLYTRLDEALV